MDAQIVEWLAERPQDWWQVEAASVHTWGRGTAHQLGHSTMECTLPDHASQWEEDMRLIVAGNLCTYGIKFDGSLWSVGEGLHGRLGHGGTIGETSMRLIGALQGKPPCLWVWFDCNLILLQASLWSMLWQVPGSVRR